MIDVCFLCGDGYIVVVNILWLIVWYIMELDMREMEFVVNWYIMLVENCRILYDDDDGGVVLVCEFIDWCEVLVGYGDRCVCFVVGD